ncbi:hypothetical protein NQ318_003087 [Aromia moschata]|uniref:TTI1 N-terminal TPR domain-containing protein n=1 Tax=Aromia moschata TaxID=1265417 RepID=A0AAV8XV66_9CUCU|nr:hypothetical protein NQ318_003087 [Aromia moschata]
MYSFLLFEVYDRLQHKVLPIHEEYKLRIMECMTSLAKCMSSELMFTLYTKENSPKLCQMLYIAIEIAKTEQLRSLRIAAIECIMAIARVLEDKDFEDLEVRNQVAEMFLFFLPGIASGLKRIALEDEKVGHKIPVIALKGWGRIVTLLMQDYNVSDEKFNFIQLKQTKQTINKGSVPNSEMKRKFKDDEDIKSYLQTTKRTSQWYKDTDKRLQPLVIEFVKLAHHSHPKVRSEMAIMCGLIVQNCFTPGNIIAIYRVANAGCLIHLSMTYYAQFSESFGRNTHYAL